MSKIDWEAIDKKRKEIEKASMSELEAMAFVESERNDRTNCHIFKDILEERKYRLDKEFVFTPEYIEKFLWLDQEIKKYANILREKAKKMLEDVERMTKDENSFFNDYYIECIVMAHIPIDDDDGDVKEEDKILEVIESFHYKTGDIWKVKFLPNHIEHSLYFEDLLSDKDKENGLYNWSCTIYKWRDLIKENPELAKHNIGYGMHQLCDDSLWAFQDIMRISDFYCDLKVEYQKF